VFGYPVKPLKRAFIPFKRDYAMFGIFHSRHRRRDFAFQNHVKVKQQFLASLKSILFAAGMCYQFFTFVGSQQHNFHLFLYYPSQLSSIILVGTH
jgi:hypothetical protein